MMAKKFEDFTKVYSLSKTLRFEARPVGATLRNIWEGGLIQEDEHRAESYVKVKKLIDEYHKEFIDNALREGCLFLKKEEGKGSLEEYYAIYSAKEKGEAEVKKLTAIQQDMREKIVKAFKVDEEKFKRLFGCELFVSYKVKEDGNKEVEADLVKFIKAADDSRLGGLSKEEALALVGEFKGFTTYFTGFWQNRENMYSSEEKATGIAYRLINENLPKFIDNMEVFKKIMTIPEIRSNMSQLYSDMEECLNVGSIGEMFELGYYNLLLTQKQIDVYNAIIGGKTDEDHGVKTKGINEYVNLYNQHHKEEKLPKLKTLFKQILSDRTAISWLPEEFDADQDALTAVNDCLRGLSENVLGDKALKQMLCSLPEYDLDGVFISNDLQLTEISQRMFGRWNAIQEAVVCDIKRNMPPKRKEAEEKYEERIADVFKRTGSFSIKYLNECLSQMASGDGEVQTVDGYFAKLGAIDTAAQQCENVFAKIANTYADVKSLLTSNYPEDKSLAQDKSSVAKIKELLDSIKALQRFVKPMLGSGLEGNKDERFYGELSSLWEELDTATPLYNMVRNYMTRKPYSQKKIKLNFENSILLGGWDANKERDYGSIILRRDGRYYLAIMNKQYKKLLGKPLPSDGECYEKMVYKLLPGPNKMLPKVFFPKKDPYKYNPSERVLSIYNSGTFKKSDKNEGKFNRQDLHDLIDFYKQAIGVHEDWSKFGFKFSDTSEYNDVSGFYREVEQQGYKLSFTNVSKAFIDNLVEEGKMYLFEIYNKDFSKYSKGTPNIHTLYWRALFDERNLADVVYKLNGEAELFYRKKSIDSSRPTHPANKPVANKNECNKKKESVFVYDLIKDRRYTVDKFQFHVPITMNFKSGDSSDVNMQVKEYLQGADDVHVIGIDRGERHLLYLVVVDLHGNIKEQFSLNEIVNEYNGNTYRTNYHDLLDAKEKERLLARQSWQTIENIKELKEGYLSQVIHKITQLMVKYHAIVVLEDLNLGFMRGRQKVEKQVYQKFEKMLIDKLNYLVDKKSDAEVPGGLLNAFQLTDKFVSFQKLGKQSGFLFYIPAWNTSKIDPVTGFVNLLDTRYQNIEKTKSFFSKFDAIRYDGAKGWFEFSLDYDKFGAKAEGSRTKWVVCTHGKRIYTYRNPSKNSQWDNEEVDLTVEFKKFFEKYGIDICGNLKDAISAQTEKDFFETMMRLMRLTLQMRNSITGSEIDYLVSPVADENGNFYDSRSCDATLPKNADANGAYNIARKGLMLISQIKEADDLKQVKFDITNKSWLRFAQQKPYADE